MDDSSEEEEREDHSHLAGLVNLYSMAFDNKYMFFSEKYRREFGHSFKDLIVGCVFQGNDCLKEE